MNDVAIRQARLPMPQEVEGIDAGKWRVLCESIFPNAKTTEAIAMALDYCRVRGLDVFKRPVNIVPMWNKSLGREVETVWPGINEIQITASRTGQYAGMDAPEWGEIKKHTFKGSRKVDGKWENDIKVEVEFPEYCAVTVYRMIQGQRCPFTEPVYWLENYSRAGGGELPTPMWEKRPRNQLLKVAKAFSLRAAFPEEGTYTAEEMEGKEIEHGGVLIEQTPAQKTRQIYGTAKARNDRSILIEEEIMAATTNDELKAVWAANRTHIKAIKDTEYGDAIYDELVKIKDKRKREIEDEMAMRAGYGNDFVDTPAEVPHFLNTEPPAHVTDVEDV